MSLAVRPAGDRLAVTISHAITVHNSLQVFQSLRETTMRTSTRIVEIELTAPLTAAAIDVLVQLRTTTEKAGKILTVDTERSRSARVLRLFGLTPPRDSARTVRDPRN